MSTSTVTPEIAAFARGVRAALADLPPDEVEELTEGLEADLAEAYAEDLQRELPDAAAYATELCAAAGLPMRTQVVKRGVLAGLAQGWRDTQKDLVIAVRRNPTLAAAMEFVVSLSPVWWVIRAWLATWLVAAFFGSEQGYGVQGGFWWLVLLGFTIVSVQWGRGLWHFSGLPGLILIGNVVAIVALLPVLAASDGWGGSSEAGYAEAPFDESSGISLAGTEVTNIFAYDAQGKPLSNIQLFDQDGRPMMPVSGSDTMCGDDMCDRRLAVVGTKLETGVEAFNVFPLSLVPVTDGTETGETAPVAGATATPPKAPFLKVPAVLVPEKVAKSNQ